ncbi:hypothetical protein EAF00_008926 [Botryotinia globosa]|nr:hypothetical protein EAF00_008926 [Botryotinia globosa]
MTAILRDVLPWIRIKREGNPKFPRTTCAHKVSSNVKRLYALLYHGQMSLAQRQVFSRSSTFVIYRIEIRETIRDP